MKAIGRRVHVWAFTQKLKGEEITENPKSKILELGTIKDPNVKHITPFLGRRNHAQIKSRLSKVNNFLFQIAVITLRSLSLKTWSGLKLFFASTML